jgi:hypothetical protein
MHRCCSSADFDGRIDLVTQRDLQNERSRALSDSVRVVAIGTMSCAIEVLSDEEVTLGDRR